MRRGGSGGTELEQNNRNSLVVSVCSSVTAVAPQRDNASNIDMSFSQPQTWQVHSLYCSTRNWSTYLMQGACYFTCGVQCQL